MSKIVRTPPTSKVLVIIIIFPHRELMALSGLFNACSFSGQSCKVGSLEDPCQDRIYYSFYPSAFLREVGSRNYKLG